MPVLTLPWPFLSLVCGALSHAAPAAPVLKANGALAGFLYSLVLYDFEVKQIPVQWWLVEESFTLTIISQNYEVINQIASLMQDLFRRYDESAVDLNVYLGSNTEFLYHNIMIDSIFSPEPFGNEGDYQVGSVVFSYNYSRKTDPKGRF